LRKEYHNIDEYTLIHENFPHHIPYIGHCAYSQDKVGLANATCFERQHTRSDGSTALYYEPKDVAHRVFCLSADRHFARFGFPLIENGSVAFPLYLHSRYVSEENARPEPFYEMTRDRFRALYLLWEEENLGDAPVPSIGLPSDEFIDDEAYVVKYVNSKFHNVMMSIGKAYLVSLWQRARLRLKMHFIVWYWRAKAEASFPMTLYKESLMDVKDLCSDDSEPFFSLSDMPSFTLLAGRFYNWDTLSTHPSDSIGELSTGVDLLSENSFDEEMDRFTVMPIEDIRGTIAGLGPDIVM
jgi:hypothetical protein